MIKESMMKWRVRRESRCNSIDHEDIRRSLEILDNVLAEFDDGGDNYFLANGSPWVEGEENGNHSEVVLRRRCVTEIANSETQSENYVSFRTSSADGSTSQSTYPSSATEQCRKFSPPPVPKRSPGTRLSGKENQFRFTTEGSHPDEPIEIPLLSAGFINHKKQDGAASSMGAGNPNKISDENVATSSLLSQERVITTSSNSDISGSLDYDPAPRDEDVFVKVAHNTNGYHWNKCSKCGHLLSRGNASCDMEVKLYRSPSVAKRRENFENKSKFSAKNVGVRQFLSSDSGIDSLPVSNSPFLKKKKSSSDTKFSGFKNGDDEGTATDTSTKLTNSLSDSRINQITNWIEQNPSHETQKLQSHTKREETVPPSNGTVSDLVTHLQDSSVLCERTNFESSLQLTLEERIKRLDLKFAHVKFLLKTNQISVLKQEPPAFVPPPPPKPPRKSRNRSLANDLKENSSPQQNVPCEEPPKEQSSGVYQEKTTGDGSFELENSNSNDRLCDLCIARRLKTNKPSSNCDAKEVLNGHKDKREPSYHFLSNDLSQSSNFEPLTSTIEDLPKMLPTDTLRRPQYGLSYSMEDDLSPGVKEILTSTPKSDKIQLSTFSQSISSLGYGSSQSDQDLNLSFNDDVKVPVVSLKSQTLPTGIKLVQPAAYVSGITTDCDSLDSYELQRSLDLSKPEVDHFRSSSAPPLKHLQRSEKKYIFGMSKKDRRFKDKNAEEDVCIRSNHSSSDGGRRLTALNGSMEHKNLKDIKEKGDTTEDGVKRKSVWKSILRRK